MLVPNRNYSSPSYRYGFQGQEKDDEIKGNGNSLNYKYRMHDPRVGRFFAVDPLAGKYPYNSTYVFSQNRVVDGVELEGLEHLDYREYQVHQLSDKTYQSVETSKKIYLNFGDWSGLKTHRIYNIYDLEGNRVSVLNQEGLKSSGIDKQIVKNYNSNKSTTEVAKKALYVFLIKPDPLVEGSEKFHKNLKNTAAVLPLVFAAPYVAAYGIGTTTLGAFTMRSSISFGTQYLFNNGKVNMVGVVSDGLLFYKASSFFGSFYEFNINFKTGDFESRAVFVNKSFTDFSIDFTSSLVFGSLLKNVSGKNLEVKGNYQRFFAESLIELNFQLSNYGNQKATKEAKNKITNSKDEKKDNTK